jgi:ADP-ribose pyrophosphatase YjhB (NUDIX family)
MEESFVKNTKSAGGVVINKKGEILIISQHGTTWSLPKGHIDEGETDIEASKREIYEESGIMKLEFISELGNYKRYKIGKDGGEDKSELKTITIFLFKTDENMLNPIDPENPEARWVPKEKVAELLTHPKDKEFFLSIADKI